jgi:hypothetical protein
MVGFRVVARVGLCSIFLVLAESLAAEPGVVTGPASGSNVEPSTAIQKQQGSGSPASAGDPGVEAKPGTEGGRDAQPLTETPGEPRSMQKK